MGGGGDTHGLYQLAENDGGAELQQGDVVVRGELVVLGVEEDATDQSGDGGVAARVHHTHAHVGTPGARIRVPTHTHTHTGRHTHTHTCRHTHTQADTTTHKRAGASTSTNTHN